MKQYLDLFIDKYLTTDTLNRLKYVTQFCGCDYTRLYSPLFKYTRFDHSLVVAHMTWHFTHNIGNPCFAHCIDYVFGDFLNQESSEKDVIDIIKKDNQIQTFLKKNGISIEDLNNYSDFHILENKSPKLCTDRLDKVLHTCYIWLHTHSLGQIKEVYNNLTVLENEDGYTEIGFKDIDIAEKFISMVYNYAKELQGNTNKYVMKFISEIVRLSVERKLISLDELYTEKEEKICNIFNKNFQSWKEFNKTTILSNTNDIPENNFYISFETKKSNLQHL